MNIAVNTRFLLKDRLEGIGRFSLEIARRMVLAHPEDTFYFIFDRPFDASFVFAPNVVPVYLYPPARRAILWKIWNEWSVKRYLKKIKADVYFSPDGYVPLQASCPMVSVFHDLAFEHYPKDIPNWALRYYKKYFPKFAHASTHLIAVSQYTKQDVMQHYGVADEKIRVVYNGSNEVYTPSTETEKIETRKKHTQEQPYFLFVGAIHPRKNVVNLLKSFEAFKTEHQTTHKLVLVGRKAWDFQEALQVYEAMKYKEEVIFTGHLEVAELRKLYGAATALLYISYFEGFGIPIIEALSCQCPVITSNVSSMPEVLGKAGLLVDPFSIEEITKAMSTTAFDVVTTQNLLSHAKEQLGLFSWDTSAQEVYLLLKQVVKPAKE